MVAARAHVDVVGITDLPADLAGFEMGKPAQEDDEAHHRGGHQHVGVPAEPGEVQRHLLTEVVPDVTNWLLLEHVSPPGPFLL